ncbi:uncharacterized protein NPIL_201091 [Nephila pilipes]|uniref:Reverse transcriptase domain-containing protein n=1 Tax=Nephila pilipes TaxID=299642 RepID=A0A8X6TGT1_NEPPI|nr:uncharacterized protein NPIL_201091 [Nephila pilipes]
MSVVPLIVASKHRPPAYLQLLAANGTVISTYGQRLLILDLGLRRVFQWPFIFAPVSQPIIGADFLSHYRLLVDIRHECLVDSLQSCRYREQCNNGIISESRQFTATPKGLVIRDDPVLHERDQDMENFKETTEFENGRYIVQLPFRKSYNKLCDNYSLVKQRFQNLWRRFGHDSELYQLYREIIRDYTGQGIIEVKTETTDKDQLNAIAFCSDIKQAFLQICLANEHTDAVRFLWSDDEPCFHKKPKLQVNRFNRVNFGVSSSPFLLTATIRHHIEKYKHEFPDTVELLDRSFYVYDLISGGNEFEEALQTSLRAKYIMEAAGMDLRKWITNDANLMDQWKKEKIDVHPIHETKFRRK